uniref:Growth/differentiation factor 9 n=1 Tax=Canis lupus familiaris TaxID=9615 RepID=I1TPL2_CANLF|nr:growth differentiation factor 9 variant [Canis lupus familiaris]
MALLSNFFLWFFCLTLLCFPISLGSQVSRGEARAAAGAESESVAEPWSLLRPPDGRDRSGFLSPLFKVLYDGQGGTPRALRYMKRLYKACATKEGIPKSNRSPLYNTVRLFTSCAQHTQAPGDQATGEESTEGGRSSRHRRGQDTVSLELHKPLAPASFNLSEYLKHFLFPQHECELHDFRLSFSQLKWDNWIVAPHRYNPRYCKGDCPRAVGHRYGSPVHTMVQNIIHEKLNSSVPRPSCVPAKYSPLSVLTIEPDGSIAYKEYEDMIATKCTCR